MSVLWAQTKPVELDKSNVDSFFQTLTSEIHADPLVRAYVSNLLVESAKSTCTIKIDESITLLYWDAVRASQSTGEAFHNHKRIGDSALFTLSFGFAHDHYDVVKTFGMLSYNACYNITMQSWEVFKVLSDNIDSIAKKINRALERNSAT